MAQPTNTAAQEDEVDTPTYKRIKNDTRVTYGWLPTKAALESPDFYFAAQGHDNGAIVQAQAAKFTFSQPVCVFPSQRGIS